MKKYFLTGLVILLPVALTIMIILFLFDLFTDPFVHLVSGFLTAFEISYDFTLPHGLALFISRIFALMILCIFITFLGALARWFLTKKLLEIGSKIISRIPVIKTIYTVSKDIFVALFSQNEKKAFKYPVFFPFPRRPSFSLGFKAGDIAPEIASKIKTPLVAIFMPTAPHPISGLLFLCPEEDVYKFDMSNEEAVKFLVSCGMVIPNAQKVEIDELF